MSDYQPTKSGFKRTKAGTYNKHKAYVCRFNGGQIATQEETIDGKVLVNRKVNNLEGSAGSFGPGGRFSAKVRDPKMRA